MNFKKPSLAHGMAASVLNGYFLEQHNAFVSSMYLFWQLHDGRDAILTFHLVGAGARQLLSLSSLYLICYCTRGGGGIFSLMEINPILITGEFLYHYFQFSPDQTERLPLFEETWTMASPVKKT